MSTSGIQWGNTLAAHCAQLANLVDSSFESQPKEKYIKLKQMAPTLKQVASLVIIGRLRGSKPEICDRF